MVQSFAMQSSCAPGGLLEWKYSVLKIDISTENLGIVS